MSETHELGEKHKLLTEIINRLDIYINATNSKVAIILSYCIAYIAGLGFKLSSLSDTQIHNASWYLLLSIYLLSVVFTLLAAHYAYRAMAPQLPSGRATYELPSTIFFGDIAKHPGGRDGYVMSVLQLTEEDVVRDLAKQAYTLATIADSKFALIVKAYKCIVRFQIPLFALFLVLLLTAIKPVIK